MVSFTAQLKQPAMEMHLLYLTKEAGSPLFPSPMLATCLQQSWLLVGTLRLAYPVAISF